MPQCVRSRQSRRNVPSGPRRLTKRTVSGRAASASTISARAYSPRMSFQKPESLFLSSTCSNVHFTSSAETGTPSDQRARSSMTNV